MRSSSEKTLSLTKPTIMKEYNKQEDSRHPVTQQHNLPGGTRDLKNCCAALRYEIGGQAKRLSPSWHDCF